MSFTNALHTEVRLFYPKEYAVGCYALAEIQRRFQVELPEDEAASIALHLLNAEYENSLGITMQVTQALGRCSMCWSIIRPSRRIEAPSILTS